MRAATEVTHPGFSAQQLAAADAKGAQLVRASTAIGIALSSSTVGVLGFVLGFAGLIGAAVVGQIGRAHQGRII